MNDLIIKKKSENTYDISVNNGSTRWYFSINNEESLTVSGAWVRVGSCGSVPVQIKNHQSLFKVLIEKLCGEYERHVWPSGEKVWKI